MRRVLKFGGSLLRQAGWREALAAWGGRVRTPTVIVPGGGVFADAVRLAQPVLGFDEGAAHEMAVLAMAQTACVLRGACPGAGWAATPQAIEAAWRVQPLVVWQPTVMPDTPASWAITSDSLAAWLAAQLQATELALVKSCAIPQPAHTRGQGREAKAAWDAWAEAGLVDAGFAGLACTAGADVRMLGLQDLVDLPP